MRKRPVAVCVPVVVVATMTWTRPVPAQPARAAELHREGVLLLESGKVDPACAKLAESVALDRTAPSLLDLARCHEFSGKTASAWSEYVEASLLLEKAGDVERATRAKENASRLAPRISRLRIDVAPQAATVTVRRDGVVVGADQLGSLLPIDPGTYAVTAEAPDLERYRVEVRVDPDGDREIVVVPPLKRPEAATKKPQPGGRPSGAGDDGRRGTDPLGIGGFVSAGVGVVGLVMGTVFGVQALTEASDAEDDPLLCPDKRCTPAGRRAIDEVETKATASTVTFAVGGVALAAGVVMLVVANVDLSGEPKPPSKAGALVPFVGPDGAGAAWTIEL